MIPFMPLVVPVPSSVTEKVDDLIAECLARIGMKHETLAALLGKLSYQQLSQARRGQGGIWLTRLVLVAADPDGRAFLREFLPRYCQLCGVEDWDATAAQLRVLTDAVNQRRMVRAELPSQERRTA